MTAPRVGRYFAGALSAAVIVTMLLGGAARAATPDLVWLDDRVAIGQFVDGVMASQIARGDVVGATVSITHHGEVVLTRGYGLADLAAFRAVDADQTLFRVGSISKVLVWMAVVQQMAAGQLDLEADVNSYLKTLQIPHTYPQPITLTHLMTHTAGFEDRLIGLFAYGPMTVGDFHSNLIDTMPRRVMIPGHFAAYSNYGAALAAHIVELASGEEWDAYADNHILKPLAMSNTTTLQPVPPSLAERVSNGYFRDGHDFVKAPFEFVTMPPAGSVSTTGPDMARLMIELLGRGDSPVLTAAAREQLFAPGFAHDPRLNRMRYGMYEKSSHGETLVGHDGDTMAFYSSLVLCPALDLGVFVSYNSAGGEIARDEFIETLLDRIYGRSDLHRDADKGFVAERYVGYYSGLRTPSSGHDKIAALLPVAMKQQRVGMVRVSADTDGYLLLSTADGTRRFVKVEDNLFAEDGGTERVAFEADGAQASHMYFDSTPYIDFERVAPSGNPWLHLGVLLAVVALGVLAWVVWPISSWRRRDRIGVRGETGATLLALANAALIIGFLVVAGRELSHSRDLAFGLPKAFQDALWVPVALVPLVLLQLLYALRALIVGYWWAARVTHYGLFTIAAIAFVVWAFYWHLTAVIVDF